MGPSPAVPEAAPRTDRSLGLVLVAVVVLVAFHYGARTETLGLWGAGGRPVALTGRPLAYPLHGLAALVLLCLLPLGAAWALTGVRPSALGLGPGARRRGLVWLAVGVPAAVIVARLASGDPAMRAVYPLDPALERSWSSFPPHLLGQIAYYVGWETLFRGVLLGGLHRRLGFAGANIVQAALSTLAHFGRPLPETLAALPCGLALGGVARHTQSIWYVTAIHLACGAALDWFLVG
jgi:membrane protease YdiL (CAAX protease family)